MRARVPLDRALLSLSADLNDASADKVIGRLIATVDPYGDKSNPNAALRYRIAVKSGGDQTTVSVQKTTGEPETGENAQRIVALLSNELK